MAVYVFLALACLLFIAGIIFILKGYGANDDRAVPIKDMNEIKAYKKSYSEPTAAKKSEGSDASFTEHVIRENLKKTGHTSPFRDKSREELIKTESIFKDKELADPFSLESKAPEETMDRLQKENSILADALRREVSHKGVSRLSREDQEILRLKEAQLKKNEQIIESLSSANHKLSIQLDEEKDKAGTLKDDMAKIQQEFEKFKRDHQLRVNVLEDDIKGINQEKEGLARLKLKMEEVVKENNGLKEEIAKRKIKVDELEHSLEARKKEADERLVEVKSEIGELKSQQNVNLSQNLSVAVATIDRLTKEKESLLAIQKELQNNFNQLRDMNASLIEKEKMLQYQLTKHRAEALGLEKICEDFKEQIEFLSKIGPQLKRK